MNQVRNLLKVGHAVLFSSACSVSTNVFEHLTQRALIRISGKESSDFLQGLITNDMNHLERGMGCMFTMFLNIKGRVLYDSIIYKTSETDTFFIECDVNGIDTLCRHLKIYRVRRQIDVTNLKDEFDVFALFNIEGVKDNKTDKYVVPCDKLNTTFPDSTNSNKVYRDLLIYRDPRIADLGSRILCLKNIDAVGQMSDIINIVSESNSAHNYRWFRYNLGVGEGIVDLPPDNCFPLEANCDYLHGVSFHKGCYLGQELTARTHHTGVVRKRLMPLYFSTVPTKLPEESKIVHESNNLGKLRGVEKNVGLGLLRITKALEYNAFSVGNGVAQTAKPVWWPLEAPKERLNLAKS